MFLLHLRNPVDKLGPNGQFCSGKPQRCLRFRTRHPSHFKENPPRLHRSYPLIGSPFSFSHPRLCRFFRNWLVGENPNQNLPLSAKITVDRNTTRFDLVARDPTPPEGLHPKLTKFYLTPHVGKASHASLLVLAELCLLRHQ